MDNLREQVQPGRQGELSFVVGLVTEVEESGRKRLMNGKA